MREKIDKRKARKLFNAGLPVWVIPSKYSEDYLWSVGSLVAKSATIPDFDEYIDLYQMHKCDTTVGRICAYYADRETLLKYRILENGG